MLITLNGEATPENKAGSYDFTNSIRSGFELKPDTKIALVSAAIERVIDIVIVSSTNGNIKVEVNHTNAGGFNYTDITIPSGTYSYDTLLPEIQTRLNNEFGNLGYLFNVHLHDNNGNDEVRIQWNASDPASVPGLPSLPTSGMTDSTKTTATPNGDGETNKLVLGNTPSANIFYMAASPNTMPNYQLFSVPNETNPKLGNFVEIGDLNIAPAADEAICGAYDPSADLPDGYNFNVGAMAMILEPAGQIRIVETKYTDLDIDYICNSQDWEISFNVGAEWKFVEYAGGDGNYDYVLEEQGGAREYYVKKIPGTNGTEAYFNYTNTGTPNEFDLKMTLNGAKDSFAFTDPSGVAAGTCDMKTSTPQVPPNLSTNHGLGKIVATIPAGSIDKAGGVMTVGWGKEGYVKYFIKKNKTDANYVELTIGDPDRPTVSEMFGGSSGHEFDSYYGIKMTGGSISSPTDNIDLLVHSSGANTQNREINQDFKDTGLTNYNCTVTEKVLNGAPSEITNTSSPAALASNNADFIREPFRDGIFQMIINTTNGNPSGQFGLLSNTEFNNLTAQGSPTGGLWNNNGDHQVRLYWTTASGIRAYVNGGFANGSGAAIPWATLGANPKIEIRVDGGGHCFFSYYKESEQYITRRTLLSAGVQENLIPNGEGISMLPYWYFADTNVINTLVVSQENHTATTGVVAFNPDTMNNILGFNAGDYVEGQGDRGFTSNRDLGFADAFTCASPLIHINLKNLPLTSLNGKTNREEKVIAVVPRYNVDDIEGNANNAQGNKSIFYYEPYNMLYQPLDNAMSISMNELAVSILNNDGTFATDLECVSLCLDIQPNPIARPMRGM